MNSGLPWPAGAITITVRPGQPPGIGVGLDLPIAIAILTASGAIPAGGLDGCVFVAELGLDGSLRPVRGMLPALLAAARAGAATAVVAPDNAAEAGMAPGLAVIPCHSLGAVAAWLRREPHSEAPAVLGVSEPDAAIRQPVSLARTGILPETRLALETSAAGGHHLCLTGPRDALVADVAAGLAAMLPPLTPEETLEVSAVHSTAGLLRSGHALVTRPPFRMPSHAATPAAMAGGGPGTAWPGEAALAHRGVLYLHDAAEFGRDALVTLRQPLSDGQVTVSRAGQIVRFPARFTLVASLAPCACEVTADCACTPLQARRYRDRFAGELGRYIPVWSEVARLRTPGRVPGEPADADDRSAQRVGEARDRARHRLRGTPWQVNADIPGRELRRSWQPPAEAVAAITRAVDLGEISTVAAHQVVRVAWTLADLDGRDRPDAQDCGQALAFQLGAAR